MKPDVPKVLAPFSATLLLLTAACGNGGEDRESTPTGRPSPTVTTSARPTATSSATGTSPSPASPSPTATAPGDPAAAEARIRANWQKFFASGTPVEEKTALAEDGELYGLMVEGLARDERAGSFRAQVHDVSFTSATEAGVTYVLSSRGRPVDDAAHGTAVLQDDTWKLSFETLCGLARLGDDVPQAATCP